jgi:membrane-associated phospholipid phosphatase
MSVTLELPQQTEARQRLGDLVPGDAGRVVRLTLMGIYCVTLVVFTKVEGMIWRRLDVALALGIFLLCAYIGRPLRTWLSVLGDVGFYCAMWYAYETTRGAADEGVFGVRFPLQLESVRNIDRFLFGGHDPNVVLQRALREPAIHWYDVVCSVTYMSHFVVPPIVMGALWATSRYQWWRFMKRFATVLVVACGMFIVFPTAPPWMASDRGEIDRIIRHSGRGFTTLHLDSFALDWQLSTKWGNGVAAMPSLHAAFSLIVPAFFLPWVRSKWLKALMMLFPAMMLFSLVYFGEHWVIDGLVGFALVGGSFWFWNRFERRQRCRRAARAKALPAGVGARS